MSSAIQWIHALGRAHRSIEEQQSAARFSEKMLKLTPPD
jgi:hypothetical protein